MTSPATRLLIDILQEMPEQKRRLIVLMLLQIVELMELSNRQQPHPVEVLNEQA